jgi:hypothetical protein
LVITNVDPQIVEAAIKAIIPEEIDLFFTIMDQYQD